ncbi:MAG: monovalent cation/H+ antiporter complex subunit F [Campylobacterales bacterium]
MTLIAAALLSVTLLAGLWRMFKGPGKADRLPALQLLSTVGVALLILLGSAEENPFYYDVALIFALLAAVGAFAFTKRGWSRS